MTEIDLLKSPTSAEEQAALNYVAAAMAECAHVPGLAARPRPVRQVGVIGAGTMGGGIAMAFVNAAFDVVLLDSAQEGLDRGLQRIRDNFAFSLKRGKLTDADVTARLARIHGTLRYEDLAESDLIIEAVFEEMGLKRAVFRQLDAVAKPGAILATNTSGLDINEIAQATGRPCDVVGAHFFSPAHVQKLLEVVQARDTAPDVVATLMALGLPLNKHTILSQVYPGFIGNALFRQYIREAHFLVEDGAMPHEVDQVLEQFGYAMGVFRVHDMAGNDVGWQMRKALIPTRPADRRWNDLILALCDNGRFGQKCGKGWYRYEPAERTARRDAELEQFVIDYSRQIGTERRTITPDEVLNRCVLSMVNEGARLLEQRVALRPGDIDVAFLTGYGFPKSRGGPMYLADRLGLDHVYEVVRRYHAEHGYWWKPAPLLKQLAATGDTFAAWAARQQTPYPR
jgi:3-hydroxyacyl-CoA dehydrogenase